MLFMEEAKGRRNRLEILAPTSTPGYVNVVQDLKRAKPSHGGGEIMFCCFRLMLGTPCSSYRVYARVLSETSLYCSSCTVPPS